MPTPFARGLASAARFALALALAAAPLAAASVERNVDRSYPMNSGSEFDFENLAGKVTLVAGSGTAVAVHATIHAEAGSDAKAQELAGSLQLVNDAEGSRVAVHVQYPTDRHDVFCYPRPGQSGNFSLFGGSRSSLRYRGDSVTVVASPTLSSVTLWADVRIEVPAGVRIEVKSHVGNLDSKSVAGDQKLDTNSGDVAVSQAKGKVSVDTGSGDVNVDSSEGEVVSDTGSGDVVYDHVKGRATAKTGSGDVTFRDVEGDRIYADTGSGDVTIERARGSVIADTGSGTVKGRDLVVAGKLRIDTGSGDVRLSGDLSKVDDLYIDTGSGDVVLDVAALPSGRYVISTGSGDIDTSYPDLRVTHLRRDYIEARLGEGSVNAKIDTGSGDITLRQSH